MINESFYICKRNIYLDIDSNKLSYIEMKNSITLFKKHEKYYRITSTYNGVLISCNEHASYNFTINLTKYNLSLCGSFFPARYERKIKIIKFLNQTKE
jgi:hypothetical protein